MKVYAKCIGAAALSMATVAGASPVAQAATVEVPVGTIAVGGPSVAQAVTLDDPEETLVPTGIPERMWKHTSRVLGSYVERMSKLAYCEAKFSGIGVCVPTDKGTWLLLVKWRG